MRGVLFQSLLIPLPIYSVFYSHIDAGCDAAEITAKDVSKCNITFYIRETREVFDSNEYYQHVKYVSIMDDHLLLRFCVCAFVLGTPSVGVFIATRFTVQSDRIRHESSPCVC
jgi:hypothetical protein